jgi:hypothetical protein
MVKRVCGLVVRWEVYAVAAVALTLGVLFVRFVYTPTRNVTIANDWGAPVSASGCTSDVIDDVSVDGSVIVDAKGNGTDRCVVYSLKPYGYIGCLRIPAGVDALAVSQVQVGIPESDCQ